MNSVIINKEDLRHNIEKIKEFANKSGQDDNGNNVKIIAVVKGNGYGLDIIKYVNFLIDNGIEMFAVATLDEALKLRKAGIKQDIIMLSTTAIKSDIEKLIENNIIISIGSQEDIEIAEKIAEVNEEMKKLINNNFFRTLKDSLIYVERTQADGRIRKGLMGKVDLEDYSFAKDSQTLIRATEGTVLERIPPRVKVRENAPLELPHIMLLIDDDKKEIIEGLTDEVSEEDKVYDTDLMKNGGHIKGYKLNDELIEKVLEGIGELADKEKFEQKYNVKDKGVLLFSVGDGNHSLATAKTCYENLKKTLTKEEYENHPARYALVEVVNLHSDALDFEPIHRVVFGVNPEHMMEELKKFYETSEEGEGQVIQYVYKGKKGKIIKTLRAENKVIVEGVHVVKKHQKPTGQESGGILEVEAPINASNVMIIDPKTKKRTRIGHTTDTKTGKKIRIAKKSNEKLD